MMTIRDNAMVAIPRKLIEDKRISTGERSVLICIALADKNDGITLEDLCKYEGRCMRTIRKYLKHLIECGYIEKTENSYIADI